MEKMESFLMLEQVVHTVSTKLYGIKHNWKVGYYVVWVTEDIRVNSVQLSIHSWDNSDMDL
jgi:hypothetical protein